MSNINFLYSIYLVSEAHFNCVCVNTDWYVMQIATLRLLSGMLYKFNFKTFKKCVVYFKMYKYAKTLTIKWTMVQLILRKDLFLIPWER